MNWSSHCRVSPMPDGDRDDGLKNPMRFSIRNRRIDIENYLRHPDFDAKQVTELEIQDGQLYVHWEWCDEGEPTAGDADA